MASTDSPKQDALAPPVLNALKNQELGQRATISRTSSTDIRAEREDLKAAAEQSLNVMLDLALDGTIRGVSPSWKDVVGTSPDEVKGKAIADLLLSNQDSFASAIESMKNDDSKSHIIRFRLAMGPESVFRKAAEDPSAPETDEGERVDGEDDEETRFINLKGQGIMVYDRSGGGEGHTMWMLRPSSPPKEVTIDLPEILVESLGVGAEMLAQYLTSLAEAGTEDPAKHPPPLPIMCRICERQITPWWFEKHSDGCTQEYQAESDVSLAQDQLTEHRPSIVKVLDALDPETRQGRPPVSGETSSPPPPKAEYKGYLIGTSNTSSPSTDSGRASPALSLTRSREPSVSGLGHSRSKSFAVRRPLSKIVTLLVDLCDTALDISMPSIKPTKEGEEGNFRSQSPQSESRISQVLGWQTPSVATSEDEQGLAALIKDTENLAQAKVDAVLRHREILEYTERIRVEFTALVHECIDIAIKRASSIKAGNLSDSSSDTENEEDAEPQQAPDEQTSIGLDGPAPLQHRGSDAGSVASEASRRQSLAALSSTRSSSPMECPTPRSHAFGSSVLGRSDSVTKRSSMLFESDAADSDTNMTRSAVIGSRRTESPEVTNSNRSVSSGDRKRRSLKLPNMPSPHRQPSPGRSIPAAPGSPLRIPKPRVPLGLDTLPQLESHLTSPPLSSTEHSSPLISAQRHRRQSSAASSIADPNRAPPSPRLNAIAQPPARALPTSIKDFEIIKPISKGAFGSVYLSKKKSTGDYFAIKVLRKADMVAKNQVTNVKAERAIMMWQGESDFVAKLYWTFSSKDYLFLVMEYLNGGDCASLVKVLGGLPEDWAKKYLAEVVLGVEHLHSRGIVHRDLKPDNLLIDQRGHLKLTDFGLSRMGLIGRQKRALKSPNDSTPDLLKYGPFARTTSITSSRSASFDMQGANAPSPQSTPILTPDLAGSVGQPSYFSLNRETILGRDHSRRKSGFRSDSANSDTFNTMFRNFSLNSDDSPQRGERIEEESHAEGGIGSDLYTLRPTVSNQSQVHPDTPPQSNMLPPAMALFDPDDENRRFVGTPDYLAPETINGLGQDEMSDWWSLGCILFEFLYGYPPFHADAPEKVFENILARRIDWPSDEDCPVSEEAKDLMLRLMTVDTKERLGSNMQETHASGGDEIRRHPWFESTNWDTLLEDEASFIPAPAHPEDTEYFDARGATLQAFTEEMQDQGTSPVITPGVDYPDRPHDALSRVRSQVNSMKRGLMPLHIPPHVRDSRNRRLSEPVANDDFGNFSFKNLPVLEKANKELLQKMRNDAAQKVVKPINAQPPSSASTTGPSLEGSPLLSGPLNRTLSANKGIKRPGSPSTLNHPSASPSRTSQPTSPLVSFSTGQSHERRKTSSTSSTLSHQSSSSLQPGTFFEPPRLPASQSMTAQTSVASSPVKSARHSMNMLISSPEKNISSTSRPQSMYMPSTSRARSQTVGSQEDGLPPPPPPSSRRPISHNKRHSQVFDISPSSSDNEDPRTKALLRVQRRRQSSRRMSQIVPSDGPTFRPLDVLICEDHPVSRLVMERLLEKLKCRTIAVVNGSEAARYAMSEVQFDIIMMEVRLPQISGTDVARMIRDTKSANTQTPIIAVTGYLNELPQPHHFDSLIQKPATVDSITEALRKHCNWKPSPVGYQQPQQQPFNPPSGLRQESKRSEESPGSQTSGPFSSIPGLHKRSSREHSIGSSFFGDTDSTNTEEIPIIMGRQSDDWAPNKGLGISDQPTWQQSSEKPNRQDASDRGSYHSGAPHLIHQNSAPPSLDIRTPRKQRSAEAVKAKREDLERNRHECGESGDDEDDELGIIEVRARSPQGKQPTAAKRASKLGVEMMRTNSRGSIDEIGSASSQHFHPNPIEERADEIVYAMANAGIDEVAVEDAPATPTVGAKTDGHHSGLTPPERFLCTDVGPGKTIAIDMDATPRPTQSEAEEKDEDEDDVRFLPIQIPQTPNTPFLPRHGQADE